jgi:hypothetical protein
MKLKDCFPLNIWGERKEENYFRKVFTLEKKPSKAFLRIFVDTGYELFINGRFLAAVDEWNNTRDYDAAPFLVAGRNLIAVKAVNHGGHRGFALAFECPALSLVTDASWLASPEERWGWRELNCDDYKWGRARVLNLEQSGERQWHGRPGDGRAKLVPNLDCSVFFNGSIPKCVDSPFFTSSRRGEKASKELLDVIGMEYQLSLDSFPAEVLRPVKVCEALPGNGSLEDAEGILGKSGRPLKAVAPRHFEGPSTIIDFGGETVGFLRLRVKSEGPVHLRLHYGETLSECHHLPSRDMLLRKMITEKVDICSGLQEWESHSRQGFRFVKVEFKDCLLPVEVDAAAVRTSLYQTDYSGYFSCSDPLLNKIWTNGLRTLHLCMQEYYLDGIKRDRFLWTGDTRMHALINYYTFGDTELFKYSWRHLARFQYSDGAIPSVCGEGAPILWDYVAWWIIALEDYRMHVGDMDFLKEMKKPMLKAIDWLLSKAGKDGLIDVPANKTGGWFVVLNQAVGKDPLMNFLFQRSLNGVSKILESLGDGKGAVKYAKLSEKTGKSLGKFALTPGGCGNRALDGFEVIESLYREGRPVDALNFIREYWGYMAENGGDTLYEGLKYDQEERVDRSYEWKRYNTGSHCHAWTAGPTCSLLSETLGIKPLLHGFKEFEVKPQLGDLAFAKGVVPTPYGSIVVNFERKDGGLCGTLVVPKGCKAKVGDAWLKAGRHSISMN